MTSFVRERLQDPQRGQQPWYALWAMMIGFFMILVDATIVAVANPEILNALDTDYDGVLWVTSAYLLAYAVPLLLAGRLGDRFGPKNLYLIGLAVFTVSSLGCGLAGSIEWLVAARVVQGLGAALMTPQTLSTITRIFPAERRGVALSVWGATAGVATLVGPLAGGVLVDGLGWQWIFIVNVPVGVIGLALAFWFVPSLPTERAKFDIPGVLLSGIGLFLIVFGLQEGESNDWAWWIWALVVVGLAFVAAFVYWQTVTRDAPLVPLKIFADRDFSLSNVGIAVIGFAVTAMVVPVMFYAQAVCGLSPTRSALLMAPMAIASGVLAPFVGRLVDRTHPSPIVGFGFSAVAIALTWLSVEMTPVTPIWRLVLPLILMGVGMAFIWSPLAATATRHLAPALSGAGSGVYNTTRQIGSVLGSAGIAAFMTSRITAEMPGAGTNETLDGSVVELPVFLKDPFAAALAQSLLLPAFVALFGVVAAIFLHGPSGLPVPGAPARKRSGDRDLAEWDAFSAAMRGRPGPDPLGEAGGRAFIPGYVEPDYFPDDDEYVEYTVEWDDGTDVSDVEGVDHTADVDAAASDAAESGEGKRATRRAWIPETDVERTEVIDPVIDPVVPEPGPVRMFDPVPPVDHGPPGEDDLTEPLTTHVDHPLHAPADTWHSGPVESWHSLLEDDPEPQLDPIPPQPAPDPIGHAHNGFHLDSPNGHGSFSDFGDFGSYATNGTNGEHRGSDVPGAPRNGARHSGADAHQLPLARPSGGRHSRGDDDPGPTGRHSRPG